MYLDENQPRIFALGENALTIDFGNTISSEINSFVLKLSRLLDAKEIVGVSEIVSAYSSLTIFYDVVKIRQRYPKFETTFEAVKSLVEAFICDDLETSAQESRLIRVPICCSAEFALDLEFVTSANNLTRDQVIKIFLAKTYRVFMLGFLPGFAYMGEVDEEIAIGRKDAPRVRVPAGSVGIAARQTGVYPLESPGGWQIIGRTPLRLFNPHNDPPTFFQPGDLVQFYEVDENEFAAIAKSQVE